eukprot:CAMPEP_0171994010 /NCGR_PEP_ID=MMETSP0993-20121228/278739_1 /TAXON_ID=483369 /ORGANISM="non described non described, Strain CCMP2098" /LENGTH=460 /DNA_ID=CAMNT_0012647079 /DNA_START=84 /DNA_END=1466 /DNA_ORIENTATION=+
MSSSPTAEVSPTKKFCDTYGLAISGGVAGCVAKTITAPLSRLTILFQVHSMVTTKPHAPQYAESLTAGLKKIVGKEGFAAFWKGNGTSVVHRFPYSAINFYVFETSVSFLSSLTEKRRSGGGSGGGTDASGTGKLPFPTSGSFVNSNSIRFVCGALAGGVATTACYPLDLVRTRLTTQVVGVDPKYKGMVHALGKIAAEEGAAGLYKGLAITLVVQTPNLAISYSTYGYLKEKACAYFLQRQAAESSADCSAESSRGAPAPPLNLPPASLPSTSTPPSSSSSPLASSSAAAAAARESEACAAAGNGSSSRRRKSPSSSASPLTSPPSPLTSPLSRASSVQTNENNTPSPSRLEPATQLMVNACCGALSGITSTLLIYPLDLVRRRMQMQGLQDGGGVGGGGGGRAVAEVRQIVRLEGVRGLYRGLPSEICKIVPMVGTTFCVYELMKDWFGVNETGRLQR